MNGLKKKKPMGQDPNPTSFELVPIDLTEAISGKSVGYPNNIRGLEL